MVPCLSTPWYHLFYFRKVIMISFKYENNGLNDEQLNNIIENTKYVLNEAIKKGGTTIRTYTSSEGVHGRFQQNLLVHNQTKCKICNNQIKIEKIGGRSTYYCPNCQK